MPRNAAPPLGTTLAWRTSVPQRPRRGATAPSLAGSLACQDLWSGPGIRKLAVVIGHDEPAAAHERGGPAGLPPVIDLPTAAAVLDVGRTVAYELVRTGRWPTPVFRLGGRIKVPTAPLLELLGVSTDQSASLPATAVKK
jgi:hypothetical protein